MFYAVILLLIIVVILLMKINIVFEASPANNKVRIVIFRLIKINIIDKTKKEHGRLDAEKIKKEALYKKIDLRSMVKDLKDPIKELSSKLQVDLKFRLVYGLSSPDKTAISYGILNSLIYSFDLGIKSLVKKYCGTYKIYPDMKKPAFDYNIEVRLSFRIFSILPSISTMLKLVLIPIYKAKRKEGMKDGRTSNRKLNENYNG